MKSIEYIVGCLIVITLSYIFYPKTPSHKIEPEMLDTFDDYPIEYWKSQDDGGDDRGGAEHNTAAAGTSSALPRLRTTSPSSLRVRTVLG